MTHKWASQTARRGRPILRRCGPQALESGAKNIKIMQHLNLLSHFSNQSTILLDGALATELEQRGHDISGPLWSARLLQEAPNSIRQLHYDYLVAGADIITTATYQASFPVFKVQGITKKEARRLMQLSVQLARDARDQFWEVSENRKDRHRPLIAASAGPYGAYLADGSEYRGDYGLSIEQLMDFHRERLEVLLEAAPDLIAFETIPSRLEAKAIARLLEAYPKARAWISFSCKNEQQISEGQLLADCVRDLDGHAQLVGVGINCTPPEYIAQLIKQAKAATDIPIIVYPNSGEGWDAERGCWIPNEEKVDFTTLALQWQRAGARVVGGCCRTGVRDVERLRKKLLP